MMEVYELLERGIAVPAMMTRKHGKWALALALPEWLSHDLLEELKESDGKLVLDGIDRETEMLVFVQPLPLFTT